MRAIPVSRTVAAFVALALAGACSNDPVGPTDPPELSPAAGTMSIAPKEASILSGSVLQIRAQVVNGLGYIDQGVAFKWMTSNPAVATVSAAGTVSGLAEGDAVITIMAGDRSRTSTIHVLPRPEPKEIRPIPRLRRDLNPDLWDY